MKKPPESSAWRCDLTDKALKTLSKYTPELRTRILRFIRQRLETNIDPRPLGKSLSGVKTPVWRFRVGDYRLLCEVHAAEKRLMLLDVGNRDGIYLKR